jgi:LuxR family maltose regulon positive regulatory protein
MAEFDALESFRYYLEGAGRQAVIHGERALDYLDPEAYSVRGWAVCLLALGYQMTGKLKSAYDVVYDALKDEVPQTTTYHSRLFITLCLVQWIAADLNGLRRAAEQALKLGKDANLQETISIASYSLGIAHYMRNELPEADHYLNNVVNNTNDPNILNYSHSAFALALSHLAQSRLNASRELAKKVIRRALDSKNTEMLQNAEAFQAELDLRQGNISRAERWARHYDPEPFHPGYRFYLPQLTFVRVLLTLNDKKSVRIAGDLLSRLHDYYESIHNARFLIDVLTLQALLHDARGDESAATEALENALMLAEPSGFVQPFLDPGPKMADLLNRLGKQNIAVKYVGKLLSDFREERAKALQTASDDPDDIVSPTSPPTLVDSLTNREFDILIFLSQRMSNKEIAEKLFISPLTVKKHSINIYSKLNVNSRQQAVEKARAMGII